MSNMPDEGVTGRNDNTASQVGPDEDESPPDQVDDTQPIGSVPSPPRPLPPPPASASLEPEVRRRMPDLPPPPPPPPLRPSQPAVVAPTPVRAANPIAVAALVAGLVAVPTGILFITAPLGALLAVLALTFGLIGITKARRTNAAGMGMSIAGMVTGFIGLIAASLWLALWIGLNNAPRQAGGLAQQIQTHARDIGPTRSVYRLSIGDCYDNLLGDANVHSVSLTDCSRPHRNEVFAVLRIDAGPNTPYPGVTELRRLAGDRCKSEPFTDFVGAHYYSGSPLMVDTIFPNPTTWAQGDRDIICVISDPAGPVTGTMRDSERRPSAPQATPAPSPLRVYPVTPSP
jgi:hypothetical protein